MVLMVFSILITMSSCWLGLGSFGKPGAGLMPFGIGIVLFLCSGQIVVRSLIDIKKAGNREETGVWVEVNFRKIALVLASLVVYLMLLERLGFLVTAFLMLLILFKVVGSQKWSLALVEATLTMCFVYFFFIIILDVYMPFFPFTMR